MKSATCHLATGLRRSSLIIWSRPKGLQLSPEKVRHGSLPVLETQYKPSQALRGNSLVAEAVKELNAFLRPRALCLFHAKPNHCRRPLNLRQVWAFFVAQSGGHLNAPRIFGGQPKPMKHSSQVILKLSKKVEHSVILGVWCFEFGGVKGVRFLW